MYKWFLVITAIVLMAAACDKQPSLPQQDQQTSNQQSVPPQPLNQQPASKTDWNVYKNTIYGYELQYPQNHTLLGRIEQDAKTGMNKFISAAETDRQITLYEAPDAEVKEGTENISLNVEIVPTDMSSKEWVNANAGKYTTKNEIKSVRETTFNGMPATELYGAGNLGSVYRLIAVRNGNNLIVIVENAASPLLEKVLSTFKFTN